MQTPRPQPPIGAGRPAPRASDMPSAAAAGPEHWQGWWPQATGVCRHQRKKRCRAQEPKAPEEAFGQANEQGWCRPRERTVCLVGQAGHPTPTAVGARRGCRPSGPSRQPSRAERISSAPWPRRSFDTDKPKASGSVPWPSAWHRREPSGMPIRARSQSVLPSGSVTQ